MTDIIWTQSARDDLEEIITYSAQDSSEIALEKLDEIRNKVLRLKAFAEQGRAIPELREIGIFMYRELISSPWRIMYRIEQNKIFIIAVVDGRRNIEDVLFRRNIR